MYSARVMSFTRFFISSSNAELINPCLWNSSCILLMKLFLSWHFWVRQASLACVAWTHKHSMALSFHSLLRLQDYVLCLICNSTFWPKAIDSIPVSLHYYMPPHLQEQYICTDKLERDIPFPCARSPFWQAESNLAIMSACPCLRWNPAASS